MASKWIPTAGGMCYVWREISWEEALGTIVARLEEIRDDPKRLHIQAWEITGDIMHRLSALGSAFGTPPTLCARLL